MELLTINDVAARLKISKSLAYALVESGKLVPYRIGLGRGAIVVSRVHPWCGKLPARAPRR